MEPFTVKLIRGYLALVGLAPIVPQQLLQLVPQECQAKQRERDGKDLHVTIANKSQVAKIKPELVSSVFDEKIDDLVVLGLGQTHDVYILVVYSHKLHVLRNSKLGLGDAKDFHITLGFKNQDMHDVRKGSSTVLAHCAIPINALNLLIKSGWDCIKEDRKAQLNQVLEMCMLIINNNQLMLGEHSPKKQARVLDLICAIELHLNSCAVEVALEHAKQLCELDESKGWVRQVQCLVAMPGNDVEANFAALHALELCEPNSNVERFLKRLLSSLNCPVDSRCLLLDNNNNKPVVSPNSPWLLNDNKDSFLAERIHTVFGADGQHWEHQPSSAATRRCLWVSARDKEPFGLPRFFSWIVPQRLCGMSTPRSQRDVEALVKGLNIGLIVTLTVESPLPKQWFHDGLDCDHAFLPCDNYNPPTLQQVDEFIALAFWAMNTKRSNKAVLVHCGGGKGRAGTMLACWLVRMGGCNDAPNFAQAGNAVPICMACSSNCSNDTTTTTRGLFCPHEGCLYSRESMLVLASNPETTVDMLAPKEAIDRVQRWRPGSIETREQELFVHAYANELWKRTSKPIRVAPPPLPRAPVFDCAPKFSHSTAKLQVEISKAKPSTSSFVVLAGFPGSGKSTLAKLLLEAKKIDFVISGDELGGKQAVEQAVGGAVKSYDRVLVDRCHVDKATRMNLLELAFNPTNAICVFMDLDADECKQRAASRLDHPIIPHGGGEKEVDFFVKRLQVPTCSEGFSKVYRVISARALEELLRVEWGIVLATPAPPPPPQQQETQRLPGFYKFPRTPHLCRMGEMSATRDDLHVGGNPNHYFDSALQRGYRVSVEEKIDGANLGLSICPTTLQILAQNRSHYISSSDHPQFAPLHEFLSRASFELRELLQRVEEMYPGPLPPILFGEWLMAKHSIVYDAIPDYFVAFDLLLPNGRFASRQSFRRLMGEFAASIPLVPSISLPANQPLALKALQRIVRTGASRFRTDCGNLEGVYIRIDDGEFLKERSKIVREDFIAGNQHWTKHSIQRNKLSPNF